MKKTLFAVLLIALAAVSRILPHPANVAPITALALFGGVHFGRRYSFLIPIGAMVLSDAVLGYSWDSLWVYGSFLAIAGIGLWLRSHRNIGAILGCSLAGSILFFIVTNFGVWVFSTVTYPHTLAGLAACYVAAIPFFRNTVIGDLVYVTSLFGVFELGIRYLPALRTEPLTEHA